MTTIRHKIAKLVSFVFHPVIFAVLLPFLIVYHTTGNVLYGLKWMIFSIAFLLFALLIFFFVEPVTFLTDFDISHKEKRPVFYTIMLFFSVVYFLIAMFFKGIFFPLSIVSLGIIIGLVIFEFINFFLKVSVHTGVASAYLVTVGIAYGPIAFFALVWIPFLVAWSRLLLRKHTLEEIITGMVVGAIVTLLTFAIGRILI